MPPVAKRKTAAAATAGKLVLAPIFRSSKNKNQSVRGGGKRANDSFPLLFLLHMAGQQSMSRFVTSTGSVPKKPPSELDFDVREGESQPARQEKEGTVSSDLRMQHLCAVIDRRPKRC